MLLLSLETNFRLPLQSERKKSFYGDTDLRHHTQRMKVYIYMEVFLFYCVSILYTGFIVHLVYLL